MDLLNKLKEQVDNYTDTIYAIVGFMNLFRFDDESGTMRSDVFLFQGCKLYPDNKSPNGKVGEKNNQNYVTPDIGIIYSKDRGIIGEVKASFPSDRSRWIDDFIQLMKYDKELCGWPTSSGNINSHEIVLLLHYSRAVAVRKYYEEKKGNEIIFARPFCIIEYHRSSQSKEFFSLRTQYGSISEPNVALRLEESVEIPMKVFVEIYSTYKLYDAQPPMPYLLDIIWTHIVALKAKEHPKFQSLRRNQKIEVEFEISEMTELLYKQFSFAQFQSNGNFPADYFDKQPKYPKQSWIREACAKLIKSGDANWIDENKGKLSFKFVRRDDIYNYFLEVCSSEEEIDQLHLFSE